MSGGTAKKIKKQEEGECLRYLTANSLDQVNKLLADNLFEGIDFCCFDLFDTIISRKVNPEYLKVIWAHQLILDFGINLRDNELYQLRRSLEGVICKANRDVGLDDDLRYIHFARSLFIELKRAGHNLGGVTDWEFAERALSIEIKVELENQYHRPEGVALLKAAYDAGVRCIVISDTYLPYRAITAFLRALDVFSYFDRIFLSSEPLVTKRSGRLYRYVLETLRASPSRCMMVGDNQYSDIERGGSNGLNTLHLPVSGEEKRGLARYWSSFEQFEDQIEQLSLLQFPFQEMIFPIALFCKELHKHVSSRGVRHLFFCSREGQPLKKFYEIYREILGFPYRCTTHYLYVSRRATLLAGCRQLDEETFEPLFRQYRNLSSLEFLQSLGMSMAEAKELAHDLPAAEVKQKDYPTSGQFKRLKELQAFQVWYETARKRQNEILWTHLSKLGEVDCYDSINIVDVGWKGTIQDNLRRIIPPTIRLNGFYLGLLVSIGLSPINAKFVTLFSDEPGLNRFYDLYSESCSLFEILLGADHGSVRSYSVAENDLLLPELDEQEHEKILFRERVGPLLNKMYEEFPKVVEMFLRYDGCEEELRKFVALKFMRPVLAPTADELRLINGIHHYENFGLFCGTSFGRVSDIRMLSRLINSIKFLLSPSVFRAQTAWPALEFHRQGIAYLRGLYIRDCLVNWFSVPPSRVLQVVRGIRRAWQAVRSVVRK